MDLNQVVGSVLAFFSSVFVTLSTKEEGLLLETEKYDKCFLALEITEGVLLWDISHACKSTWQYRVLLFTVGENNS